MWHPIDIGNQDKAFIGSAMGKDFACVQDLDLGIKICSLIDQCEDDKCS